MQFNGDATNHESHRTPAAKRPFSARWLQWVLLLSVVSLTDCGSNADWYYHFICNGDQDCLDTNPTGMTEGDLNEGPDKVNCTQLMVFAEHSWGAAAKNWCDQYALPGNGVTSTMTYDANGSTGGTVPIDMTDYVFMRNVTVMGNPGNLTMSTRAFMGWSSHADGSLKVWAPGEVFQMTENVTLFAIFAQ